MRNAIKENIERMQVANRMERRLVPVVSKSNQVQSDDKTVTKTKTNVNFEQPIEAVTLNQTPSKEKEIENIEAKNELISNLGVELEGFYKQLQGRLKSQYDLENWKKKRSQMALKRLGLQTTTITEEETSITGPDDKVFETFKSQC